MQRSRRLTTCGAVALAVMAALAGCASGGSSDATATATATRTVTASPTPSGSGTATTTPAPGDGTDASSAPSGSGAQGAVGRCATADLSGSIEPGSGGAAGSVVVHLVLTNTGSTACTLQGWPGVSFVGGGNGAQIGAAATQEQGSPHPTVTLAAGQRAVAPLKIGQAADYGDGACDPRTPDGFRVYPPGSEQSLFVADTDQQACASTSATLLSVQALVPDGQATS